MLLQFTLNVLQYMSSSQFFASSESSLISR